MENRTKEEQVKKAEALMYELYRNDYLQEVINYFNKKALDRDASIDFLNDDPQEDGILREFNYWIPGSESSNGVIRVGLEFRLGFDQGIEQPNNYLDSIPKVTDLIKEEIRELKFSHPIFYISDENWNNIFEARLKGGKLDADVTINVEGSIVEKYKPCLDLLVKGRDFRMFLDMGFNMFGDSTLSEDSWEFISS